MLKIMKTITAVIFTVFLMFGLVSCKYIGSLTSSHISKSRANDLINILKKEGTTSFLIMDKKGEIIFKYGNIDRPLEIYSLRKSFLNLVIGYLWDNQKIKLNSTLEDYGIKRDSVNLTDSEQKATVKELLKSRSGVYVDAIREIPYYRLRRPKRNAHKSGGFWYYNNWGFDILAVIAEKASDQSIKNILLNTLFPRIGIDNFSKQQFYQLTDQDHLYPSFAMKASARNMGKLGLIYLNKGKIGKDQILSTSWIEQSTKTYSSLDRFGGFGFLFWTTQNGWHFERNYFDNSMYSSWGYGGQHLVILPKYGWVIVHLKDLKFGEEYKKIHHDHFAEICRKAIQMQLSIWDLLFSVR